MNAEQEYYQAVDQFKVAFDHVVLNDIKIRSNAAKKAQRVIDLINAGVEIDEPDGEYDD